MAAGLSWPLEWRLDNVKTNNLVARHVLNDGTQVWAFDQRPGVPNIALMVRTPGTYTSTRWSDVQHFPDLLALRCYLLSKGLLDE